MPNNYTTPDYELMRSMALKLKGMAIQEDLPINDFLDRAARVHNDLAIEPEWSSNEEIMATINGFNEVWDMHFDDKGYDYGDWINDLKEAAAEDLDEF